MTGNGKHPPKFKQNVFDGRRSIDEGEASCASLKSLKVCNGSNVNTPIRADVAESALLRVRRGQ